MNKGQRARQKARLLAENDTVWDAWLVALKDVEQSQGKDISRINALAEATDRLYGASLAWLMDKAAAANLNLRAVRALMDELIDVPHRCIPELALNFSPGAEKLKKFPVDEQRKYLNMVFKVWSPQGEKEKKLNELTVQEVAHIFECSGPLQILRLRSPEEQREHKEQLRESRNESRNRRVQCPSCKAKVLSENYEDHFTKCQARFGALPAYKMEAGMFVCPRCSRRFSELKSLCQHYIHKHPQK